MSEYKTSDEAMIINHDDARALIHWSKGSKLFKYIEQQEKKDELIKMYKKMIFANLSLTDRVNLREKIALLEKEIYPGGFKYYGKH
jgi:hypothetical protein